MGLCLAWRVHPRMRMSIASRAKGKISPHRRSNISGFVNCSKENFKASKVKGCKECDRENIWMKPRLLVTTVKNALLGDSVTRKR